MSVFVFPKKNPYHWFLIGNQDSSFSELLNQRGHPVSLIHSEEELLRELSLFKPSLIFLEEKISWVNVYGLLEMLNRLSEVPKVLVMEKSPKYQRKDTLKKAYQAGVLEVLELPLNQEEWLESLKLFMRLSHRISSS